MGKAEDVQSLPGTVLGVQGTTPNAGSVNGWCLSCIGVKNLVTFRCVFALVLGVGVFLSAIFWLPFFHFGDHKDLDLDLDYAGHDIVASFRLKKPASFLKDYILKLEDEIFDEIRFSSTKVEITSLESSAGSNITKLTASLFGNPFSFDVLKFRGGITASPVQKAFLMQNVQILFNFTLNFSIDEIVNNFDELRSQLKTGLYLAPYENLYIKLTNLKGSTVAPPTIVESQVLLAVGINPSKSRLKQLAQTISGSHTKNLGLDNTVFGRVKQVRLSSILQHSLGSGPSPSPSPSPSLSPSPISKVYHHYRQRHHSLSPSVSLSPSTASGGSVIGKRSPMSTPVPAPAPGENIPAEPPACHFGYKNRFPGKHKHSHMVPSAAPVYAPHPTSSPSELIDHRAPDISPAPADGPLPNVAYAHDQLPPQGEYHSRPPDVMPLISAYPSQSSAGSFSSHIRTMPLFILLTMHL